MRTVQILRQESRTLGREEGIRQESRTLGREEGIQQEKVSIARTMLQKREPQEKVVEFTGLTKKELDRLVRELGLN